MLCDNKNNFQIFETSWVQYLKKCKTSNSNILFLIWLLILKHKVWVSDLEFIQK